MAREKQKIVFALIIKIALLTTAVHLGFAYILDHFGIQIKEFYLVSLLIDYLGDSNRNFSEAVISTFTFILLSIPVIYFGVVGPYTRQQENQQKKIRELFFHNEAILLQEKKVLEVSVERAIKDLKKSEERYALAALGANDGLWDIDLRTKETYYSERWKEILGYQNDEIKNDQEEWIVRVHPDDLPMFKALWDESKSLGYPRHFEYEYRMYAKDGSYKWVLTRWIGVFDKNNQAIRMVGSQTDIDQRKQMESKLLYDALHDGLTGLANRTLFNDRLQQALIKFKRNTKRRFAVMLIDLDNFKRINDTLGHSAGDQLLVEVAKRIKAAIRESDSIARLGGDEFAIIIDEFESQSSLEALIHRLHEKASVAIKLKQTTINPSISIGVVISNKSHADTKVDELLSDADLALYRAKSLGKGCFSIFDSSLRTEANKQFEIGNSLKGAIERGEISLFYQPIVDIQTGFVAGFEGLMRWNHPRFGWVSPAAFIPIAEESAIIHDLGKYAIEEGCKQIRVWQQQFTRNNLFMSINVSPRQFENMSLLDYVDSAIRDNKLLPGSLKVEVTESLLISQGECAAFMLKELKKIGVKIAIDDFGVGYSSLSTLYHYPFDTLKIDRSFINEILHNQKSQDMVRLICMLAKSLGMKAVAEGIEIVEQFDFLKSMGCAYAQGYLMSKPLPQDELTKKLCISLDSRKWNHSPAPASINMSSAHS